VATSSGGQEAKFSLVLEDQVSSAANQAGDSLDSLRQRIAGGEDAIKNMRAAFNRLRGSTDDVKAAKAELTAKLNSERDAISAANLKLLKSGTTYDSVAAKAKKLAGEQSALKKTADTDKAKAFGAALGAAGGPVASLKAKLSSLTDVIGGEGAMMGIATAGVAAFAAAIVAMGVAIAAGIVKLSQWIIVSADARRSLGLDREVWAGSVKNANNLGTQIDALAEKVPTSKAALNGLANSLMKLKLGGQATVDTFNAVGQASSTLGDEAANKIQDFITRGRLMGRMQIDPREMLEGFGDLNFDDVAKALAKNTKKTVEAARLELRMGRTKLGDGAKAMRDAIEQKFGGINLRKMMSLEVMSQKLHEKLAELTDGVSIEPLLKGLSNLAKLFDTSTVTGAALKEGITAFGNVMVRALAASLPFVEMFLKGMIIAALDAGIAVLRLRNWLVKTFGGSSLLSGIDSMKLALDAGKLAIQALGVAIVLTAGFLAAVAAPFLIVGGIVLGVTYAFYKVTEAVKSAYAYMSSIEWSKVGSDIVDGLVNGLKEGAGKLYDAVRSLGDGIKDAFTGKLKIHSPSRVFFGYGENIDEGAAKGVEHNGRAQGAVDGMVSTPSGGGSAGKATTSAAAGNVVVNFIYQAAGGAGGDVASQVNESGVRAALVKIIQEAAIGRGVPVSA
jgi:hypothetical protein